MKRKKTAGKKRMVCSAELFCLLILSMLVSGCSSHDKQFSYFDMLDEKKRTPSNKQAAEKFWSSVRPVSTLSDSHYRLARHYQQKGEYEKAIKEFSKALRNDATYCKAHNGIAMSYDALRRCEPAHASYERALQCAPDQAYVYNNYACSSLLCGNYGKGVDLLLKAEQLAGDNIRIKNNLRIAQKIETHENISNYYPSRQVPVPIVDPESQASLPESEKALTTPIAIPEKTIQTVSYDKDVDEKSVGTDPAPPVESTSETPENVLSVTALDIADTGKLVAEKSKEQAPVPVADPESPASLPESEKALTAPVYAIPEKTVQTVSYDRDLDEKSVGTDPASTAEATGETPENVLSVAAPEIADTVKLVAEKSKKLVWPKPVPSLLDPAHVAVEVSNGNGATGMAGRSADFLREHGFKIRRITNAKHFHFEESKIYYKEGHLEAANELAAIIPGAQNLEKVDTLSKASIDIKLVLGRDLVAMRFPEGFADIAGLSGRKTDHLLTSSAITSIHNPVQY